MATVQVLEMLAAHVAIATRLVVEHREPAATTAAAHATWDIPGTPETRPVRFVRLPNIKVQVATI